MDGWRDNRQIGKYTGQVDRYVYIHMNIYEYMYVFIHLLLWMYKKAEYIAFSIKKFFLTCYDGDACHGEWEGREWVGQQCPPPASVFPPPCTR